MSLANHTLAIPHLTRFRPGSLRELWTVAFPLVLTSMSANMMWVTSRWILARYSTEAWNAVVAVGMAIWAVQLGMMSVSGISEVFVGQYNGARQHKRLGEPVWQMIYFSLFSFAIFIPLGLWGAPWMVPECCMEHGQPYYQWCMSSAGFFVIEAALAGFFIGQGKTRLVMWAVIAGNIINIGLNFPLVYGVRGWLPAMGAKGSAIAVALGSMAQVAVLLSVFLSPKNRTLYGTADFTFKSKPFWHCICIGFPKALGHMIEVAAWAIIARIVATTSNEHMTVFSVCNTCFIMFACVIEGVQGGVIAVSSNFIGAKRLDLVAPAVRSAIRLLGILFAFVALSLAVIPEIFLEKFFQTGLNPELASMVELALFMTVIGMFLDGIGWASSGVLIASGDTRALLFINATNAWLLALVPTYVWLRYYDGGPLVEPCLALVYVVANATCMYLRYHSGKWRTKTLH